MTKYDPDFVAFKINEGSIFSPAILEITGRLDALAASEAEKVIANIFHSNHHGMIVDLSSLDYISSSGLRVLLLASRKAHILGKKMALCSIQAQVNSIIKIAGMDRIFDICLNREEALRFFIR